MASQGLPALLAVEITIGHPGRPKTSTEIRELICQISMANTLWGAPRVHGELLKLGIVVSQATVWRYMPWRPKVPSPTWRSFLRNHMADTVAIDMFVVVTATFWLLYTVKLARTVLRGPGRSKDFPDHATLSANILKVHDRLGPLNSDRRPAQSLFLLSLLP